MKARTVDALRTLALIIIVALGVVVIAGVLSGCTDLAPPRGSHTAPRAVALLPSCLLFCYANTTASEAIHPEVPLKR